MMGDERMTEGSIYDIKFAYNSKPVGYTTSMSHMNELYEIMGVWYETQVMKWRPPKNIKLQKE